MGKYRSVGEVVQEKIGNQTIVRFRITQEMEEFLRNEAFKNRTSMSEVIRVIIQEYIDKQNDNEHTDEGSE